MKKPTEDQTRRAAEFRASGMPALADAVLRPPCRYPRPRWQQRVLRVVSPKWRARQRRVAEFTALVDRAQAQFAALKVQEPIRDRDQ